MQFVICIQPSLLGRLQLLIAPTRELATMVLTNFHQVAKQGNIKVHPMVAHLVDREVIGKLTGFSPVNSSDGELGKLVN
ncbi:hypothetical protein [Rhizobium leguminosarum]|uniref:hypothetical protein n=1 Tax=Rhizobium leguminosarum TaxID=384 RepID=UPI0021B0D015|nr:hypothetical protein [Rhizobium leguminosarum]